MESLVPSRSRHGRVDTEEKKNKSVEADVECEQFGISAADDLSMPVPNFNSKVDLFAKAVAKSDSEIALIVTKKSQRN